MIVKAQTQVKMTEHSNLAAGNPGIPYGQKRTDYLYMNKSAS